MRLFVEDSDRLICLDDGLEYAFIDRRNFLVIDEPLSIPPGADRMIVWSGSLNTDPFAEEPRNWMPGGQAAFAAFCERSAADLTVSGCTLFVQPHARHVLSDVPGSVRFLRERGAGPFGLALSPATMLTVGMLETLDDFLVRVFETHSGEIDVLFLHDVAMPPESGGPDALPSLGPLGNDGLMRRDLMRGLLRDHAANEAVLVIPNEKLDQQREWLGL